MQVTISFCKGWHMSSTAVSSFCYKQSLISIPINWHLQNEHLKGFDFHLISCIFRVQGRLILSHVHDSLPQIQHQQKLHIANELKNKTELGLVSSKTNVNFSRIEPPFLVKWLKMGHCSPISLSRLNCPSVKPSCTPTAAKHENPGQLRVSLLITQANTEASKYNSRRNSPKTSSSEIPETNSRREQNLQNHAITLPSSPLYLLLKSNITYINI